MNDGDDEGAGNNTPGWVEIEKEVGSTYEVGKEWVENPSGVVKPEGVE